MTFFVKLLIAASRYAKMIFGKFLVFNQIGVFMYESILFQTDFVSIFYMSSNAMCRMYVRQNQEWYGKNF